VAGYTIGFIRIPSFSPGNQSRAVRQFQAEIAYFQANTDGLVVDDMRNPGGSVGYLNLLAQQLMPYPFRTVAYEVRATSGWVQSFSSSLSQAKAAGASQSTIDTYQNLLNAVLDANAQNRGRTGPLPVDGPTIERQPARDANGNMIAYTKPLIVLVDEFSASGGDLFPATIQDNARGPILGMRTMGLGGTVSDVNATAYSEAITRVTQSLMNRKNPVVTSDFPAAPYVENIGVRPDIVVDYMTRDNLLYGGNTFVATFMSAIADQIRNSQ
jgi:C-terminal processing protease CtpA/Prc